MAFCYVLLQEDRRSLNGVCSISPRELAALGHSPVAYRAPPGWTDCWPGLLRPDPWFLAGRRLSEDGQGGAPVPLEEEERGGRPGRQVSPQVVHLFIRLNKVDVSLLSPWLTAAIILY